MIELNDETKWILGRPNFTCTSTAQILRKMGHDIPPQAEAEQAAVIHYYLCMYEKHGDAWREKAAKELEAE